MPIRNSAKLYRIVSDSSTNDNLIVGEKSSIHGFLFINTSIGDLFVKIYDKKTTPVVGTDTPALTIQVLANEYIKLDLDIGIGMDYGLGIGITEAADDDDTTGIGTPGTPEEASLQITAAPTADGDVSVTLDGVETLVAILDADTAIGAADKIRAEAYAGWTVGGTPGTDTVTWVSDTRGIRTDAAYDPGTTGATGNMTTSVQGVDDVFGLILGHVFYR